MTTLYLPLVQKEELLLVQEEKLLLMQEELLRVQEEDVQEDDLLLVQWLLHGYYLATLMRR